MQLEISNVSGSAPAMTAYLEASDNGGATTYDVPYDLRRVFASGGTDNAGDSTASKRNLVTTTAATGKVKAVYQHLAAHLVRLRWIITGGFTSSQGFTFAASLRGK